MDPSGGVVEVTVGNQRPETDVAFHGGVGEPTPPSGIYLTVSDTGMGIPAAALPFILIGSIR